MANPDTNNFGRGQSARTETTPNGLETKVSAVCDILRPFAVLTMKSRSSHRKNRKLLTWLEAGGETEESPERSKTHDFCFQ